MDNQELFITAIRDALTMSQQIIDCFDQKRINTALSILENRSRVINIVLHLDEKIQLEQKATPEKALDESTSEMIVELISGINEYDEIIQERLISEKIITQNEIAKTHKNKENFRGYNLNSTK